MWFARVSCSKLVLLAAFDRCHLRCKSLTTCLAVFATLYRI